MKQSLKKSRFNAKKEIQALAARIDSFESTLTSALHGIQAGHATMTRYSFDLQNLKRNIEASMDGKFLSMRQDQANWFNEAHNKWQFDAAGSLRQLRDIEAAIEAKYGAMLKRKTKLRK